MELCHSLYWHCPSSLQQASKSFSGLYSAASLHWEFSFCTGSLPTSGCFHCPQPRFWLLSERHPLLFSTQIAPPHWFSQTMFPDSENENCGTGVCEISNSMIHPTPWQDRKPFYICQRRLAGIKEKFIYFEEERGNLYWTGLMERTIFPLEIQAAEC